MRRDSCYCSGGETEDSLGCGCVGPPRDDATAHRSWDHGRRSSSSTHHTTAHHTTPHRTAPHGTASHHTARHGTAPPRPAPPPPRPAPPRPAPPRTAPPRPAPHPTAPHPTAPHPTAPHPTAPHHTTPHHTTPHHTTPHHTTPHHTMRVRAPNPDPNLVLAKCAKHSNVQLHEQCLLCGSGPETARHVCACPVQTHEWRPATQRLHTWLPTFVGPRALEVRANCGTLPFWSNGWQPLPPVPAHGPHGTDGATQHRDGVHHTGGEGV